MDVCRFEALTIAIGSVQNRSFQQIAKLRLVQRLAFARFDEVQFNHLKRFAVE